MNNADKCKEFITRVEECRTEKQREFEEESKLTFFKAKVIEPNFSVEYIRARCFILEKDWESAIVALKETLETCADKIKAHRKAAFMITLGICYFNMNRTEFLNQASECFKTASELDSAEAFFNLGIVQELA
jgi:hypothetical protein